MQKVVSQLKRTLSIVLALMMVLTALPQTALTVGAEEVTAVVSDVIQDEVTDAVADEVAPAEEVIEEVIAEDSAVSELVNEKVNETEDAASLAVVTEDTVEVKAVSESSDVSAQGVAGNGKFYVEVMAEDYAGYCNGVNMDLFSEGGVASGDINAAVITGAEEGTFVTLVYDKDENGYPIGMAGWKYLRASRNNFKWDFVKCKDEEFYPVTTEAGNEILVNPYDKAFIDAEKGKNTYLGWTYGGKNYYTVELDANGGKFKDSFIEKNFMGLSYFGNESIGLTYNDAGNGIWIPSALPEGDEWIPEAPSDDLEFAGFFYNAKEYKDGEWINKANIFSKYEFKNRTNADAYSGVKAFAMWVPKLPDVETPELNYSSPDGRSIKFSVPVSDYVVNAAKNIKESDPYNALLLYVEWNSPTKIKDAKVPESGLYFAGKTFDMSNANISDGKMDVSIDVFGKSVSQETEVNFTLRYVIVNMNWKYDEKNKKATPSIVNDSAGKWENVVGQSANSTKVNGYIVVPNYGQIQIERVYSEVEVSAALNGKTILPITEEKIEEGKTKSLVIYQVPENQTATITVKPRANTKLTGIKVNGSALSSVKSSGMTFDVKSTSSAKVVVDAEAYIKLAMKRYTGPVEDFSNQTDVTADKNGYYNLDRVTEYPYVIHGYNGVYSLALSDIKVVDGSGNEVDALYDVENKDGFYWFKVNGSVKGGKYYLLVNGKHKLPINIKAAIKSVTLSDKKFKKADGEIYVNQAADTAVSYEITVDNLSAANTLDVISGNGIKSAKISSDMKKLTIVTDVNVDESTEVKIIDKAITEGDNVKCSFTLNVVAPAQYAAPSKVSTSAVYNKVTFTITNPALVAPVAGSYWYEVTSASEDYDFPGIGYGKVEFSGGKPVKTTKVNVTIEEYDDVKLDADFEIKLVKYIGEDLESDKLQEGKVKKITVTKPALAYPTKITLTKKKTTLYVDPEWGLEGAGEENVVVATASFSKGTSCKELAEAVIVGDEGLEEPDPTHPIVTFDGAKILVSTNAGTELGTYTIRAVAKADTTVQPATATVKITVKNGSLTHGVTVPTTLIYKPNKKSASFKAKVVYPSGVKDKVKWSIQPVSVSENGILIENNNPRVKENVTVKNGTVTVNKNYIQPADGTDTFVVKIEGKDYAGNPDFAYSDPVEIKTDKLVINDVILLKAIDDDKFEEFPKRDGNKILPLEVGTEGYQVVAIDNTGSFVDPSRYTVKVDKKNAKAFVKKDGAYSAANAAKGVIVNVTTNDGAKMSKSLKFDIGYKAVPADAYLGYELVSLRGISANELTDNLSIDPTDAIAVYPTVNGVRAGKADGYNLSVKVTGADKKTVKVNNVTYYRFTYVEGNPVVINVKITDKTNDNSEEFEITNTRAAVAQKVKASQSGKLYGPDYVISQNAVICLKNYSGSTIADDASLVKILPDPTKLTNQKYMNFWNAISEDTNEVIVPIADNKATVALNSSELPVGEFTVYTAALDGGKDEISAFIPVKLKVTKVPTYVGKYTPVKTVTVKYDEDLGEYVGVLKGKYTPAKKGGDKSSNLEEHFYELKDSLVKGRASQFTEYFVVEDGDDGQFYIKPSKEIDEIPTSALTGTVKYDAFYGIRQDKTFATLNYGKTATIKVKLIVDEN